MSRHQQLSRILSDFSQQPKNLIPKDSYGIIVVLLSVCCIMIHPSAVIMLILFCSHVLLDAAFAISQRGCGSRYSCCSWWIWRNLLCGAFPLHGKNHSVSVSQTEQLSEVKALWLDGNCIALLCMMLLWSYCYFSFFCGCEQ